jgi:hypothetical protein
MPWGWTWRRACGRRSGEYSGRWLVSRLHHVLHAGRDVRPETLSGGYRLVLPAIVSTLDSLDGLVAKTRFPRGRSGHGLSALPAACVPGHRGAGRHVYQPTGRPEFGEIELG